MKKHILTLALLAVSMAHATPPKETPAPAPKAPKTVTSSATAAPSSASATALAPVSVSVQASPSASAGSSSASINSGASAPGILGIASTPAPTTCDGAGWSIGGSGRAGGGLLNFPGGERESCLGAQDATTMRAAGFSAEDVQRRLCAVSTIKAVSRRCREFADADAQAGQKNGASEAPAASAVASRVEREAP